VSYEDSMSEGLVENGAGVVLGAHARVASDEPAHQASIPVIDEDAPRIEDPSRKFTGSKPVIHFDKVTKYYESQPDRPALDAIDLKVYPGEFVFLVGHSGSGKSTFIRLINREIKPTSGNLYVAGENLSEMRSWRVPFLRRNIGCVFQDFKLLPKKTAFENVAFALEVIGKSKHIINTQVPEVLRLVGLEGQLDKYPDQLSGGEQQRVSIARAIVNRPPLLICDEPTGNLDPQTSLGIMRLLDRINRTGTIVLVATHDKQMVDSMRRRVVELDTGHIIRDQDRGVYGIDA
jgi:cell division transport system ATP-binding protein